MTLQEINKAYNRIIGSLDSKELKNAFDSIQALISGSREISFQDKLNELQDTYKYMLRYRIEGAKDPMQEQIYNKIQTSSYELADRIKHKAMAVESPLAFYSRRRSLQVQPNVTFENLHLQLSKHYATGNRAEYDAMLIVLFNKIWVSDPFTVEDAAVIKNILFDNELPFTAGCQIVSSLTLGLQAAFDPEKMMLLFDAANHGNEEIKVRALISILLTLYTYRKRTALYPQIINRLDALSEVPGFTKAIRTITLRFILARETEKITRKLQNEIIPEMMKLRDKFPKNLADDPEALISIEENPEWEELLASSGLTDRLKELTEMQSDGADLFHGTFSALKSFAFFNDIAHWFIPFDTERTEVAAALGHDTAIGEMLGVAPFMCDSDKYSLVFSLSQVPDSQKRMMRQQLEGHSVHMAEIRNAELLPADKRRENMVNKFVQDLYRFFSLFRRKSEFVNPFVSDFNLPEVAALAPDMKDDAMLRAVGELYFRHRHYRNALSIFERIDAPGDATLYQKIGFALQKLGFYERAIAAYEKAELLAPDSLWTLRRIASLLRQTGETRRALDYYRRIETACPDDPAVALSIGHCYLDMKEYHEALHSYYKAEFMDEKSPKPLRPIAWCAFLMRDFDTSRAYYTRLLASAGPEPQDYLNMGHLCLVTGNSAEALANYKLFVAGRPISVLADALAKDRPQLEAAGIDTGLIPLIIDSILYEQQQ
ncbi:tetratricopeptide repeat protein [Parabacteroides goldsteinii]|uniref:tetratricopeptide repeat protein n=1 Tax=Parabacteroides goldsteinii TaxID=328812 RepID=UPI00259B3A47|nr:tetratricopeptide repeat protein [Parabacteroides goldsteinii]